MSESRTEVLLRNRGRARRDPERPDVMDFTELYQAHAGDVRRFALFLSGDPSLADDIVSETFIRVCHAGGRE